MTLRYDRNADPTALSTAEQSEQITKLTKEFSTRDSGARRVAEHLREQVRDAEQRLLKWRKLPSGPGLYLIANPLIRPLKPYTAWAVEIDGVLRRSHHEGGMVAIDNSVVWFGPITVEVDG